jgi:hypothetical protein
VLALALVHHLSITANVPVSEIVDWLASLGGSVVVEWVDPEDPQAQRLLARKGPASHPDYERATFERHLGEAFDVERREELGSGTRVLYLVHPRA